MPSVQLTTYILSCLSNQSSILVLKALQPLCNRRREGNMEALLDSFAILASVNQSLAPVTRKTSHIAKRYIFHFPARVECLFVLDFQGIDAVRAIKIIK